MGQMNVGSDNPTVPSSNAAVQHDNATAPCNNTAVQHNEQAVPHNDELGRSLRDPHMLLYRALHAQRSCLRTAIADLGLAFGQPKYLSYLAANGSATQRELAEYFLVDPAAVSRALESLEREGFLTTEPAEDRRTKKMSLTPRGLEVATTWDYCCDEIDEAMLKGFTSDERKIYASLLTRARKNLEEYARGEA